MAATRETLAKARLEPQQLMEALAAAVEGAAAAKAMLEHLTLQEQQAQSEAKLVRRALLRIQTRRRVYLCRRVHPHLRPRSQREMEQQTLRAQQSEVLQSRTEKAREAGSVVKALEEQLRGLESDVAARQQRVQVSGVTALTVRARCWQPLSNVACRGGAHQLERGVHMACQPF